MSFIDEANSRYGDGSFDDDLAMEPPSPKFSSKRVSTKQKEKQTLRTMLLGVFQSPVFIAIMMCATVFVLFGYDLKTIAFDPTADVVFDMVSVIYSSIHGTAGGDNISMTPYVVSSFLCICFPFHRIPSIGLYL
jgi:hypothetical protein